MKRKRITDSFNDFRLCKYPLLLRELAKHSDGNKNLEQLNKSNTAVGNVLNQVNEKMMALDSQEPLLDICDSFEHVSQTKKTFYIFLSF